jgi:hypothetical protein
MSDLAALQRAMASVLRGPTSLAGLPEAVALADSIATGNERMSPVMQLDVYREQFLLRHLDVLRDDFRSLETLLGEDRFERLALSYLGDHPPSSFTLRDLGRELPRFVTETQPWSEDRLLADLARVEWAFVDAFDAADAPGLDAATIAAIDEDAWPLARIVLQPSVQRLALAHRAHDYRLAVRAAAALDEVAARTPKSMYVIVFRGPDRLQCLDVAPEAFALLEELACGVPLGEACERVALASGASADAFEDRVGTWFQQWTALGWISHVAVA